MKTPAAAILVGLAAVVLVWVVFFLPSSDDEQPAAAPRPVETAAPRPEEALAVPSAGQQAPAAPVAPAPQAPAPAQQRAAAEPPRPDPFRPEKIGPVEALKAAYESDARDPEAGATEERIHGHLAQAEIPAELIRRVSCVKTACKLEVRWTSDNRQGYMVAMMNLISHISQEVAADPLAVDEGQEVHPIDVYVSRIVPPYAPNGSN